MQNHRRILVVSGIVLIIILLLCMGMVGLSLVGVSPFSKGVISSKMSEEKVVCGTYPEAPCYRYKCTQSALKESIGGTPFCEDGSTIINLGEVKK